MLFDLETLIQLREEFYQQSLAADFWQDPKKAQKEIAMDNHRKQLIEDHQELVRVFNDLNETIVELKKSFDQELYDLVELEAASGLKQLNSFEVQVLLNQEYDANHALIEIHPGAGGTESQDWAEMLFRMYQRWAAAQGFKVKTIDYQSGDEAGIKSVTFQIEGAYAYGYLKGEKGVHRLVRISPFDSSGRRHTSFTSVDVMPVIDDDVDLELDPNDLVVDTHRASGAGGQHVNKTDSAVRITHTPTGLSAHVQSERSQNQNRQQAMAILKAKLTQLKLEERAEKISDIKGEQKNIEWGSQIRSYVFMPYTLVKDNRTSVEVGNVQAVMDGYLDPFIQGYLRYQMKEKK
ncbi:MAG TPA: peptide chain release factor 2 [Erysipelothrix sp.]|nr:peptide chain release factor 2 [Erysipelothrix sp.]